MKKIGFLSFGRWTPSPPFPGCAGADAIETYRQAWKKVGHKREPRVSVSRRIYALVVDPDREYFGGRGGEEQDQIGYMTRALA